MKNYLVTGAAGFIGSAVAKKISEDGAKVFTIDNLSTGIRGNIPKGVEFLEGNCFDQSVVKQLYSEKFEAIFHIAGQSSGEISFDDPVYDLQTNAQSTLILLKLALGTGCKKFIYASTMSVYGQQPENPINENYATLPLSFYGVGKLSSEHYLRIYRQYGISSTALRLFNVYGPGQNMENLRQGMVSIYLAQAIMDKHILVKGGGERFRDFVFIDDVVDAFLLSLESSADFRIYNVCTGIKTKVAELVREITSLLPFEVSVEYSGSTPGDQFGIIGDPSLIASELGWRPEVKLRNGLKSMIDWALGNSRSNGV